MRLCLVAGEASGDRLGAGLIAGLRARAPEAPRLSGVGGPLMAAEGMPSLFPYGELSVMGLAEVVPRIPAILRRIRQTADHVIEARPDALVTIDSPDFSLRVAARVRRALPGLRVIHYVAPSVWAWRPGRARKMARHVDHVLALLPFEPPFMEAAGMTCDFVGHPAAGLPTRGEMGAEAAALRAEIGAEGRPLLLLLPGSRMGELRRLGPLFAQVVPRLRAAVPDLVVAVPAAAGVRDAAAALAADLDAVLIDPAGRSPEAAEARKRAAFAAADAALAASGTVTLELAALGCPHATAYRVSPLTSFIVEHVVRVKTANLVNLVTGEDAVPEFLQRHATAEAVSAAVARLLTDPAVRAAQEATAARAMTALGRGGEDPSLRAAASVLRACGR